MSSSARKLRRQAQAQRAAAKDVKGSTLAVRSGDNVVDVVRLAEYLNDVKGQQQSSAQYETFTPQPSIPWSQGNNAIQFAEITFDRLIQVMKDAAWGLTVDWVDLTRRMLQSDSHLESVWETRIAPIAAARYDLEPGETNVPTLQDDAVRLTDACREALDRIDNFADVRLALLDGLGTNIAHAEIIWGRGTLLGIPAVVPVALVPVHPRRFAFDLYYRCGLWDSGRAVAELVRAGHSVEQGYGRSIALLPPRKYIVHAPMTINDWPTSRGLFFSIARQWWVKQWVTKYWLQGAENGANPRTVGTVPQETAGDNVVEDLKSALETLAADGVAILRDGTTVEWRDGVAEASARVWKELADCMDDSMSKRILGSTLNVQIGQTGGAYSAADSQATTTILPRQLIDSQQLWHSIERDLFTAIRDLNPHLFAPSTPVPNGHTILADDPVQVDELLVRARSCTKDELRASRGQPVWGNAMGEELATLDGVPMASAPTPGGAPKPPDPTAPATGGAAASARPFSSQLPWEQAAILTGRAATGTSLPWPTMPRGSKRSKRSASRRT